MPAAHLVQHPTHSPVGVRLNLGCADDIRPGWVNVDIVAREGVTVADLRRRWPWADSSVDLIVASHVIEHLPDKIHTMNEAWRVLRAGGLLHVVVPTTDGPGAFQDPTHVSFWNYRSFLYYEDGNIYRERYAASYGIHARLHALQGSIARTQDGPILDLILEAVKDGGAAMPRPVYDALAEHTHERRSDHGR